jgi:hypothetical protein
VLFSNFDKKRFFIATAVFGILTLLSFIAASAKDEGTISTNPIEITLAKLFSVLRFPAHTLLWKLNNQGGAVLYYAGLLVNCFFYGLLTERIFYFIRKKTTRPEEITAGTNLKNGFHIISKGREGTIYYVENRKVLEIYLEVSGVPQFDILVYFDSVENWKLPTVQKITLKEKSEVKEKLINWLKAKKIRAEL